MINSGANFNAYCSMFYGDQFIAGTGRADSSQMESWSSIGSDIVDGSHYVSFYIIYVFLVLMVNDDQMGGIVNK